MNLLYKWNRFKGRYHDINEAGKTPERVKHLHLTNPKYDLCNYRTVFSDLLNIETLYIQTEVTYPYNLPKEIGKLSNLKKLYIHNVPLYKIPDWLFELKNLEILMIRGNYSTEIPYKITYLKNLKHLRFENTDITTLPNYLEQLTQLKSLSLIANLHLTTINYKALPPHLKYLSISFSGVSASLKEEIKHHLPHLKFEKRLC